MSKSVQFGVFYTAYGRTTLKLPDNIPTEGPGAEAKIREYIHENFDKVPLPTDAAYVQDSDEFDENSELIILQDNT